MNREPVLVILNGLAAVLSLTLIALNMLGVTHLDPAAITATVAAVTAACNLFAAAIRAAVVPVGVHAEQVAQALATPTPGQVEQVEAARLELPPDVTTAIDAHVNRQAAGA